MMRSAGVGQGRRSARGAGGRRGDGGERGVRTIGIPEWEGRVSPVFDVAGQLVVARIGEGGRGTLRREAMGGQSFGERVRKVAEWGVEVLLCGGISRPLREELERAGVRVIPHLRGCVEGILRAYVEHELADRRFSMPGCGACCRWCRARRERM